MHLRPDCCAPAKFPACTVKVTVITSKSVPVFQIKKKKPAIGGLFSSLLLKVIDSTAVLLRAGPQSFWHFPPALWPWAVGSALRSPADRFPHGLAGPLPVQTLR